MFGSARPRVAVDIGGVIEDAWPDKRAWLLRRGISLDRIAPRAELLRVMTREAHRQLLRDVFSDSAILSHPMVHGAANGVWRLAERFEVILLSSRSPDKRTVTQQWVERNGLGFFAERIVSIGSRSKLDWCRATGVSCLIEDDAPRFIDPLVTDVMQIHFDRNTRAVTRPAPMLHAVPTWGDVLRTVEQQFSS